MPRDGFQKEEPKTPASGSLIRKQSTIETEVETPWPKVVQPKLPYGENMLPIWLCEGDIDKWWQKFSTLNRIQREMSTNDIEIFEKQKQEL